MRFSPVLIVKDKNFREYFDWPKVKKLDFLPPKPIKLIEIQPVFRSQDTIYELSQVDIPPRLPEGERFYTEIIYPETAREKGLSGTVVVEFVVGPDGRLGSIAIVQDIGGGCGQAVVNALKKLHNFIPGQRDNKPVPVKLTLPVRFELLE
ncbi:MAG: energy transducer TonB [Bacteroidetes bacterium]|nr:energy transducer TonB [Bacteroidota bacterium]